MKLTTHLSFNGNCEEAFRFYAEHLGGTMTFKITYADSPMSANVPEEWQSKLLHAEINIGSDSITGADSYPANPRPANGFTMGLNFNDEAELERVFNILAEDGTVTMPPQKTFWTSRFGMLTDRFGVPWMINHSPKA